MPFGPEESNGVEKLNRIPTPFKKGVGTEKMDEVGNKLYIGNLPYSTTSESLKELFASYGEITDSVVIVDKFSGRSKGFGFVTYADDASASKAVAELDGKEVDGRQIKVSVARPMRDRDSR